MALASVALLWIAACGGRSTGRASEGPGATDVYTRVAPSIAYVETPLGAGSGVWVKPGVLLTNAHVVWPEQAVRVVFPDGTAYEDAAVSHVDLMADLAVVDVVGAGGPPPGASPVRIADGTSLPVGTDVYLVGYPGEEDARPQPAMARGIVANHRLEAFLDLPYLQTDAAIGGGQSGGALVDREGNVIGFSSMTFGDGAFALAASAPQAWERVRRMLEGEDVDGLSARVIEPTGGARRQEARLESAWDEAVFSLWPEYGAPVEVQATSDSDAGLDVIDPYGEVLATADETRTGNETVEVVAGTSGPVFAVAYLDGAGTVRVRSTLPLVPYDDPDDGRSLVPASELVAALDFPGDIDHYYLDLATDASVGLRVDTVNFIPDIFLEPLDPATGEARLEPTITGALGLTLEAAVADAPAGRHVLTVRDLDGIGFGGYRLTLSP